MTASMLRRACRDGSVVRDARGRYALPAVHDGRRVALALSGAQSHRTAALAWGLSVATPPRLPEVVVPRGRHIAPPSRRLANVRWRDTSREELLAGVTAPLTTVVDCLRDLPPEESVPVADSALHNGLLEQEQIARAAANVRGPGAARARRWAAVADGRSANPFESRLRLIGLKVPGLMLVPQLRIADRGFRARVDLGDAELGIVAEADSFEWHGGRAALERDARRYDELVVRGWLVLRFSFEQVFAHAEWVAEQLRRAVDLRSGTPQAPWRACLETASSGAGFAE